MPTTFSSAALAHLQASFIALVLPRILSHGHVQFRAIRCPQRRADALQDMIGLAWSWHLRLAERGKDATAFPTALASYAARAVRSGSRLAGQERANDAAKGFGLDWIDVDSKGKSEEIMLRLVADDVPLSGRVLDLEGKPIAGVTIRVLRVGKMPGDTDLKSWLDKNIEMRRKGTYLNEDGLEVIEAHLPDLPAPTGTAADGTFRLTGFGRDRVVRLNIEGPTIVWRKAWAITRPGPARGFIPGRDGWDVYAARFEYAAGPCKPIIGTVREKGTGKPLAGIRVGSETHGSVETTTDQDGRYRIIGAAKNRSYCVVAEGDRHFNCTKMNIADTPGLEPITVNFELERGIVIRGRLTNKATGEPVRGSVYYCALADNPNVKNFKEVSSIGHVHLSNPFDTTADGSFVALAIPGPGLLCVRADNGAFVEAKPLDAKGAPFRPVPNIVLTGYHALVPVDVSENDPKTHVCNIALDPGRSVKGTVLGLDGRPLAGTRVAGLTAIYDRNAADSPAKVGLKEAEFTVKALAPGQDRRLVFLHPQKNLGKVLQLRGDEKGPLTVRLEPLGTLCGRMLTPTGQPLVGLTVLAAVGPDAHKVTTTTDKEGKFHVDGLLPGMRYLIVVGYGDPEKRSAIRIYREEGLSVESGKTKDLGDLKGRQVPDK
jgi:5-hydroxyisourate hydrolase-like protein (transthyretin family)